MHIVPLEFDANQVRVVERDGQPWFVLADVCRVLGLRQPHRVAARLHEDEKDRHLMTTPGGQQELTIVNESGLYAVILRSDKPVAQAFRKWITNEVLPSLRQTGRYDLTSAPALPDYSQLERLAGLTAQAIETRVSQSEAMLRAELVQTVGSLPATSEQRHEVKRLVREVVGARQWLSLGRCRFPDVYREAWDSCQVGSLDVMNRDQFPKVKAYLEAELLALKTMSQTGLFSEPGSANA